MYAGLKRGLQSCIRRQSLSARPLKSQRAATNQADGALGGQDLPHRVSARSLLFFGTPIVVTFSLGVWQVQRLKRKLHLIDEREKQLKAQPLQVTSVSTLEKQNDFRRVEVSGRFLHDGEMLVGPRGAPKELPTPVLQWGGSSGLQVVTPFLLETGEVVLVNRGWIPQRLANPAKRPQAKISPLPFMTRVTQSTTVLDYDDGEENEAGATKTFIAVVRGTDEKNRFTPDNKPKADEWYYIEPNTMMEAVGLSDRGSAAKVVELLEPLPKSGWPHPRGYDEFMQFRTPPSTHVTYATTWFCLSGALALLTRNRLRQPMRGRA